MAAATADDDRVQHALSCSGWLQKRHPRNGKYQKRWFELHDGRLAYFKDDVSVKPIKPPWDLLALRAINTPSTEDSASPNAFDLVFLNRVITLRPHKSRGDSVESEAFARILQRLKPHKFDDGQNLHRDAQGNELLIIHCTTCQTINGITMKSSVKRKTITCSGCQKSLKTADAITQAELSHHYTQCSWCDATFRIDPGESAVLQTSCPKCGHHVRVVIDAERAAEEERHQQERVLANDPSLRITVSLLESKLHENELIMAELYHELTDLKKAIVRRCEELDEFEEPEYDHKWRTFMVEEDGAGERPQAISLPGSPRRRESRRTSRNDAAPPRQRSRQGLLALALLAREVRDVDHAAVAALLEEAFETSSVHRRAELARDALEAAEAALTKAAASGATASRSASAAGGSAEHKLLVHRLTMHLGVTKALLHGERHAKTLFDTGLYEEADEFSRVAERLQVANDTGRAEHVALELRRTAAFVRAMGRRLREAAARDLPAGGVLGADALEIATAMERLHNVAVGDRGQAVLVELAVEARVICDGLRASGALREEAQDAEDAEAETLEDVLEEAALLGPRSRGARLRVACARVESIRREARYKPMRPAVAAAKLSGHRAEVATRYQLFAGAISAKRQRAVDFLLELSFFARRVGLERKIAEDLISTSDSIADVAAELRVAVEVESGEEKVNETEAAQLAAIAARLRTATAVRSPGKRWSAVRQARIELVAAFLTSRKRAATLQPLLSSVEGIEERAAESCGLCSCEIDLAALEAARMRVEKLAAAQTRRVEVHSRMARSQSKMEVVDPERAALFRKATGGKGGGMVDAAAAAAASRFAGARQRLLKLQTSRAEADAVADAAAKRRAERQLYIY